MADLVAFLAARLDDDEAGARPQADWLRRNEKRPGDWTRFMFDPVIGPFGGQTPLRSIDRGLYVGRVADPDRVLRQVAAGRAILTRYEFACRQAVVNVGAEREAWEKIAGALERDVADLAAVYSDHPDYDPEWGPG